MPARALPEATAKIWNRRPTPRKRTGRNCSERTVTIYGIGALADIAVVASRVEMVRACERQIARLVRSALELQSESLAHEEIEAAHEAARALIARRWTTEIGDGSLRKV